MAEVRCCFGRRTHRFAHKICHPYYLEKAGISVLRAAPLPAGLVLGDTWSSGLYGAETAADRGSQYGYTRGRPLPEDGVLQSGGNNCCRGLEGKLLTRKTRVQIIVIKLPQYRRSAQVWRTLQGLHSPVSLHLHRGQCVSIRAYSGNGDRSEPLYKTKTGYYEILEVPPTATQAQIKTSYYKQSFLYHPDRNSGSDEATVRFSEISEAYAVLGNKMLRKKYDRGLLSLTDLTATPRPSTKDMTGSSSKQQSRRSVASADNPGGIFDFDTFIRSHYSEQLQRQKDIRVRKEEMLKKKEEAMDDKKMGKMMEVGVGVLLVMAMSLILTLKK